MIPITSPNLSDSRFRRPLAGLKDTHENTLFISMQAFCVIIFGF